MQALIVTEGGCDIGFGHITRCTSLYQAFEEKGVAPFFYVKADALACNLLKGKKFIVDNWHDDSTSLLSKACQYDIIIIDSYLASPLLYQKIAELNHCPAYLDDNQRLDYPAGVVINGTIFSETFAYPKNKGVSYLLGTKYMPLRKAFWQHARKTEVRKNIENLLITFGGSGCPELTIKLLESLNQNFPNFKAHVILGARANTSDQPFSTFTSFGHSFYQNISEDSMKALMLQADVAISAGGQTLYELARVGLPTIAISLADNQSHNLQGWQKSGFIDYAGLASQKDLLERIASSLVCFASQELRAEKMAIGQGFMDGQGSLHIVEALLKR